jgi:O-antigen/teichoic acid export membrane protein
MVSLLLTSFYSIWLYTAYLRPERYGVMALALALMVYLPYLDFGFRTVINRAILSASVPEVRFDLLQFGQTLYTLLGIVVLLGNLLLMAVYGLMPGVRAENLPFSLFLLLALANGLLAIANIQWGVFVGSQQQSRFFILQTLGVWVSVNMLAWGFARGLDLWSIPIANLVSFVLTYPLSLRWIKRTFPDLKIFHWSIGSSFKAQFNNLKTEAWFCFRSQVTTVILYSADILIIGFFCPKAEVAVYYVIIRLIGMVRNMLQTGGEVGWPFLAQRGGAQKEDALPWFGLHGWIYGSVAGALVVVTIPFCTWYMGPKWTLDSDLLWAVVLRFMIVGLGSSATYLLYAIGDFRPISKCLEGELFAGLVLGTIGAYLAGTLGVAIGFLLATAGGTLVPVYVMYARRSAIPFWQILGMVWSRALLGFAGSYVTAALLLRTVSQGIYTPLVASAAVGTSLLLALVLALTRNGFQLNFETRQLRQLLRKV